MKIGIVVFPGSNCDHDMAWLYHSQLGQDVAMLWHRDSDVGDVDVIIVPGGFSFGDYLRTGALAKLSPIMGAVKRFAENGGPVIGICNGFQILCEAGLLPGVLLQNRRMKFLSRPVTVKVENVSTPFTRGFSTGELFNCPVAHFDGNYFLEPHALDDLEQNNQVVFRYASADGKVDEHCQESNPNGSCNSIAGVCNKAGNVVGLMPHPERAAERIVDQVIVDQAIVDQVNAASGRKVFEALVV
ncbi:MAG: phosphoribosylformylglycinamidine synthase subunit PurQ [Bdellovibrionales bacterium]|nr:phosphoribosylformylglycinamidine synthase subunit PurQ [Bdellovibrionales bacterium]